MSSIVLPTSVELAEKKLAKFVAFNRRYNTDGSGGPWSIEGRDYVVEEIWKPLVGYRVTPPTGLTSSEMCFACARRIGKIVLDERSTLETGHAPTCPGPVHRPVIITAVNLPRRSGKTHAILSFAMASIFLERNKRWAYIAAAEDQASELIETKIERPLSLHPELADLYRLVGDKIEVPGKNSWIEVLPTSFGSITGRGYTGVLVDESRAVHAAPAAALMGSIFDCHGLECPKGHGHWPVPSRGSGGIQPPEFCPHCQTLNVRWYARVLFASSSGVIQDNAAADWFNNFIVKRTERPHANVHVFATDQIINPSVSSEIVDAVASAFSDVEGIADYVAVETSNKPIRLGEVYVKKHEVEAIIDHKLIDRDSGVRFAVGFLDTSKTGDKTTLVICEDDSLNEIRCTRGHGPFPFAEPRCPVCRAEIVATEPLFYRLVLSHLKTWDPRNPASCPSGIVDEREVEEYCARVLPRFPKLLRAKVDTRVMPWARRLIQNLQRRGLGSRLEPYDGGRHDDSLMYLELLDLVVGRRVRIPNNPELKAELLALRKQDLPGGGIKVTDAGGGKDGRNRRVNGVHRDAIMSVAGCTIVAAELKIAAPESVDLVKELDKELEDEHADDDDLAPITRDLLRGGF
jgi:hypothetical protein